MLKTVFHIHTDYSDDSNTSVDDLLTIARECGVHCLAVTDHDTTEGARAVARAARGEFRVIVGEEISTRDGHLIGLFLKDTIEPGMSVRDSALAIREQGGLVIVPHPFNRLFGCSLRHRVEEILDLIDAVEIANAQNLLQSPNHRARGFARRHGFPALVGADSHHRGYLDACHQWLPAFDKPASFLAALGEAHLVSRPHPMRYFFESAHVIAKSRLGLALPAGYARNANTGRAEPQPVPVSAE